MNPEILVPKCRSKLHFSLKTQSSPKKNGSRQKCLEISLQYMYLLHLSFFKFIVSLFFQCPPSMRTGVSEASLYTKTVIGLTFNKANKVQLLSLQTGS